MGWARDPPTIPVTPPGPPPFVSQCPSFVSQCPLPCQFVVKFLCENEPFKQKYLANAFGEPLLFADMTELGSGWARDYRSGEYKHVPKDRQQKQCVLFFIARPVRLLLLGVSLLDVDLRFFPCARCNFAWWGTHANRSLCRIILPSPSGMRAALPAEGTRV